jgi:carbonic anhydrase
MGSLDALFANNRAWSQRMMAQDATFFKRLAQQQEPKYLWIGCSDSRVPANEIIGLLPGEVFVHRNVANLVVHTDLNCLSVLQYAVDILKVEHIMVVGHYGCGGVQTVAERRSAGLVDNWLRHIEDVAHKHATFVDSADGDVERGRRLCELNVIEQVGNVCRTTILRRTWYRGNRIRVHGLVYGLEDGLLRDLNITVESNEALADRYASSLAALIERSGRP